MLKNAGHVSVLDLFSGIGGFSLALKGIVHTEAYCDIDKDCIDLIKKNFNKNKEKKPLFFTDVKDIDKTAIKRYPLLNDVNMICAGFPCIDISVANYKGKGIDGEFSGLFYEIIRIIDLLKNISILFLENSSHIKTKGLDTIIKELKKRNFSCIWTYINASDVGALHRRKRWYCLCVRMTKNNKEQNDVILDKLRQVSHKKNIENINWCEDKSKPRILDTTKLSRLERKQMMKRCAMLGNSIVPQCAAYAWNNLVYKMLDFYKKNVSYPFFEEIVVIPLQQNTLDLKFSDGVNSFEKNRWATPVRSIWHMFNAISCKRCETTLVVQILFEKETQKYLQKQIKKKGTKLLYNKYIVNPHFIEHLMGYPYDWTKIIHHQNQNL